MRYSILGRMAGQVVISPENGLGCWRVISFINQEETISSSPVVENHNSTVRLLSLGYPSSVAYIRSVYHLIHSLDEYILYHSHFLPIQPSMHPYIPKRPCLSRRLLSTPHPQNARSPPFTSAPLCSAVPTTSLVEENRFNLSWCWCGILGLRP